MYSLPGLSGIGADVIDLTGQRIETFGVLDEEPVHFELSPEQRRQFQMTQNLNEYIREEYHALHKLLWKTGYMGKNNQLPPRFVFVGLFEITEANYNHLVCNRTRLS